MLCDISDSGRRDEELSRLWHTEKKTTVHPVYPVYPMFKSARIEGGVTFDIFVRWISFTLWFRGTVIIRRGNEDFSKITVDA